MGVDLFISALKNAKNLELSISQFGDANLASQWSSDDIDQGVNYMYNRMYLLESGVSVIETEKQTITMQPGRLYLVPAGLPVRIRCRTEIRKLYFHFNLFTFSRNDLFYGMDIILEDDVGLEKIGQLRTWGQENSVYSSMVIKKELYRLVMEIQNKYGLSSQPILQYSAPVTLAINYIRKNLSAKLSLEIVAENCFVSRSLLAKSFLKEVGMPVGKYIDSQLLMTSQWQLRYTQQSIRSISQMLGYSDACYFSRRFKQLCGMTPGQYRNDRSV